MNNSRNYDNVPPVANNTVTISTSSQQMRMATGGHLRSIAVRPQPVPIRKVLHEGPSTSSQFSSIHHQIKEDPDALDYQTASTSSGPLIASGPTTSNSFQQYQRGTSSGGALTPGANSSGPLNGGAMNAMAMDQPAPVNLASKVAEVFLTAGHAFQKLGDLTLQLHTTTDADESKWSEKEVDNLKNALTRFAHELDQISTCVASRTTKHIKNDIKRRHMMTEDPSSSSSQNMKRMSAGPSGSGANATYTTINSQGAMMGNTVPLQQKRVMQPIGKMIPRTMIPATRYTMAPVLQNSTVVVSSASGASPSSGMPQLQSQSVATASSASTSGIHRVPSASFTASLAPGGAATRVLAPNTIIGKMGNSMKRVMTPTSGALVLEQHNE